MDDVINRANLPSVLNGVKMSECDKVIEPFLEERSCDEVWHTVRALRDFYDWVMNEKAIEPCKDAVSRQAVIDMLDGLSVDAERGFEFGTEEETFIGKFEAITNVSDLPSVTAETDIDDYMKGYDHGMADAWKVAQTVFDSEVTLHEAMDVVKCMEGTDNE